ncbi:Putative membrane protein [Paucilactobacillus oligofermentans DSM 15707 = LMG 22743]|nr:DUF805 domain-containing protein [Paucilactobacillus oligofermentans]CUS25933.1 Putative membrane protein [Paucilactobacillus oligofermentans DSM 15707 = LMG 22743]
MSTYKKYWHNILNFSGTTTRSNYWLPIIINIIITFFLVIVFQSLIGQPITEIYYDSDADYSFGSSLIVFLVSLVNLSVSVRRLHDSNHSGSWIFIRIIPIIGSIVFFILMLLHSHRPNKYCN